MKNLHIDIFQVVSGGGHKNDPSLTHAISARYRRCLNAIVPGATTHIEMGTAPGSNDLSIDVRGEDYPQELLMGLHAWVQRCLMSMMTNAVKHERTTAVTQCLEAIRLQLQNEAKCRLMGKVR